MRLNVISNKRSVNRGAGLWAYVIAEPCTGVKDTTVLMPAL